MTVEDIIKSKKGTIIDVRTPEEFEGGNAGGSLNIPLQELTSRIDELKKLSKPLVLCCASGGRSGQAHRHLMQMGIECHNAGSWLDVSYFQTQTN